MLKKILTVTLISSILATSSFANQAVDLKPGDPAPFAGTLLDKEKSNDIKNELIEKDGLVKTNASLNKTIELQNKNNELTNQTNEILMGRNLELTKSLNESRETSTFTKVLYFVGGIVVTGAAVWGATRLNR